MPFAAYERVHSQPDDPTGGGPARGGQVGLGGARQNEPARARIVVDSPFDGAEDLGDELPLIDEDRLVEIAECGVWIGANDRGLSRDVQPQQRAAQSPRCGGLSAGAGADDQRGGMSREDLGELCVDNARDIGTQW